MFGTRINNRQVPLSGLEKLEKKDDTKLSSTGFQKQRKSRNPVCSFGSSSKDSILKKNMCANTTCCEVCANLPFNVRALTSSCGESDEDCSNEYPASVKSSSSEDSMDKAIDKKATPASFTSKRLDRVNREIEAKCGDTIQEVALLSSKEVKTGKRVGKGGSASVYEVAGFSILPSDEESQDQADLRQALKHASTQKQEKYVLKRISKGFLSQGQEKQSKFGRAAVINMLLEAQFLKVMNHPNIVKLTAMGESDNENLFFIMTYLPESMEQRILSWRKNSKRHKKKLLQHVNAPSYTKWSILCKADQQKKQQFSAHLELRRLLYERLHVAKDVSAAVGYLHDQGILYRDLKTSNIGFDSDGMVKLFDFGISRFLPAPVQGGDLEDSFDMSKVGTKMFMAPEIAEKQSYGLKADCYSFGVLLWQFLAMSNPKPIFSREFDDDEASSSRAFNKIVSTNRSGPRFEFPICACWPMFVQSLLRRVFQRNPNLRPSMQEIEQKLDKALEKLWAEIQEDEAKMFATTAPVSPSSSSASTASTASVSSPPRERKGMLSSLFGRNDDYGRQKTFEIDYESGSF